MNPQHFEVTKENFENAIRPDLSVPGVEYGSIEFNKFFRVKVG